MHYYKLIVSYDGSDFVGFQDLAGLKTIQAALNLNLQKSLQGKISTKSASRTDKGVHAIYQVVKLTSENEFHSLHLEQFNLNNSNIKIKCFEKVKFDFNPISAVSKEYAYYFTNQKINPNYRFIANISNPLDFEKMNEAMKMLNGKNNFCNFYSAGSNVKSTERNIFYIKLSQINFHEVLEKDDMFKMTAYPKECFQLKIIADGFLKQMIRHIVSALWSVGSGKLSIEEFARLLKGPVIVKKKWKVAPAKGLFLQKIDYSDLSSQI